MSAFDIPASHLRQFLFCPRIPYIVLALGAQPPAPPWATLGQSWHVERLQHERRRTLSAYGLAAARAFPECHVRHAALGLTGIADLVLETPQSVAVVECKSGAAAPTNAMLLQLYAYRLMAEETFGKPCPNAFFVTRHGQRMRPATFPNGFHDVFLRTLDALRAVLRQGAMPPTHASPAKCAQCEYINWCGDRI